jgi:DNA-binding GntR family transcriptional regulator
MSRTLSEILKPQRNRDRVPKPKPVLRETAYRKFMELLLDGRQKPGLLVSQRELCEMTGSSIGAMREALKRLEGEGIVSLIPQRGVKICEINEKELNDAYQLRTMIEVPAIRNYVKVATPEALGQLRQETEEIIARKATTSDQNADFVREKMRIDERLHFIIVGALDNRVVDDVYAKISNQLRLSRISVQPRFSESIPAMREHLAILDALDRRSEKTAVTAMAEHLEASRLRAVGLA